MTDHEDVEFREKQEDELGFFIGVRNLIFFSFLVTAAIILITKFKD